MPDPLRLALVCGLLPLVAGTAVFLAWIATDHAWLVGVGSLVATSGAILVLAGLAALTLDMRRARSAGRRRWHARTVVVLALLLSNIAAFLLYAATALAMIDADLVTLTNSGATPIGPIEITDPSGQALGIGHLAAGETRQICTTFKGEGAVTMRVERNGNAETLILVGYTTELLGSRVTADLAAGSAPREEVHRISGAEFLGICLLDRAH